VCGGEKKRGSTEMFPNIFILFHAKFFEKCFFLWRHIIMTLAMSFSKTYISTWWNFSCFSLFPVCACVITNVKIKKIKLARAGFLCDSVFPPLLPPSSSPIISKKKKKWTQEKKLFLWISHLWREWCERGQFCKKNI
jgi:hypothetical protein